MATSFIIGKGTKVSVALLPVGGTTEPASVTLTVAGTAQAKDTTSPATITLSGAIAAGKLIPAGTFLGFVAPTTGKIVMVQLLADAEAGDTSLSVDVIPEEIAASSVAQFPLKLSARTAANIGRTGNRVESTDFDSGGFSTGLTTSVAQTLELPGNYLASDAGFRTAEYAFTNLREIYVWIELPKSSDAYTKGKVYKGRASITDLPIDIPADSIVTGSISVAINGELEVDEEVPA